MQRFFIRISAAGGPLGRAALPVTFEAALAALAELPRLFAEPDGSFVWTSPAGVAPWQVDGILVDGGQSLYFCELKGSCPPETFNQLLAAISGNAALQFEMVEEGIVLGEAEFRRQFTLPPDAPAAAPDQPA